MLKRTSVAAFVFILCLTSATAEEQLGVAVYPGAKFDQARTKLLKDSMSVEGAAYRTNDDIKKVIEFYRKQGLLFSEGRKPIERKRAIQKTDTDVEVVVQNRGRTRKRCGG
jgi:hypothetical protein